ncbi:MAG TPA: bifunctional 5,10-methylenetetrahydrofolate dehydrogenase/5,10-methenyltetrahydrofolate cyclohydrolase [Pirellulales bacterium]
MPATILDGQGLAATLRAEAAEKAKLFTERHGVRPTLVAVLVGDDPASAVYVKNKKKACETAGFDGRLLQLPAETTQAELLDVVAKLNADPGVHGILVQLPLPKQIDSDVIVEAVHPLKDVDGFHAENVGRLAQGRGRFVPCTPLGVRELLIRYQIPTAGKHAVVVGRSDIVGKPMAALLLARGPGGDATVTVCHSRTHDLPAVCRLADVLVVAIGKPKFVTAEMVKPGAVVIDVGINRIETGLVGDVDYGPVSEVASAITPVPRGVGPLTIAMLLHNTLLAAELQVAARG